MTFAFVQGKTNASAAGANTIAATFGAAVGSGNTVVGVVSWDNTGSVTLASVTDDKGNTYNLGTELTTADSQNGQIFWLGNITNGPSTITATFQTGFNPVARSFSIAEYSGGQAVSNPSDGNVGNVQNPAPLTGDGQVSTNISTTNDGDLIIGFSVGTGAQAQPTAGTGFTHEAACDSTLASTSTLQIEDKVQSTHGSVQATFTANASGNTATFVLALNSGIPPLPNNEYDWPVPKGRQPLPVEHEEGLGALQLETYRPLLGQIMM